jgi:hypothetical protein
MYATVQFRILSSQFLSINHNIKIQKLQFYLLFCMDVKLQIEKSTA